MRKTTLSAQEIAEMDETKRKQTRNKGLKLMPVRDRGKATLSNGITVRWHGVPTPHIIGEAGGQRIEATDRHIPDGMFGIVIKGETILFNAEELSKYLRWA